MAAAFDAEDIALGRAALARGLVTREQLDLALAEQARVAAGGSRESLGQVLVRGRMIAAEHLVTLRQQSLLPGPEAAPLPPINTATGAYRAIAHPMMMPPLAPAPDAPFAPAPPLAPAPDAPFDPVGFPTATRPPSGRFARPSGRFAVQPPSTAAGTPTPTAAATTPAPPRPANATPSTKPDAPAPPDMVALVPGARVGPWRLEREIGRGGMGIIFTARREGSNELVALKVLRDPGRASLVQRFVRETKAVARLEHPNIVQLIEDGKAGDLPWYAMEFVDGGTLEDLVKPDAPAPLPIRRRIEIVRDVAHAVAYAHERGVIHRDLKPANILVAKDGVAKVTDFGLAKLEDEERKLTRTGAALGTPKYMSPEQIRGNAVDRRTDVWALGVILYELSEGKPPFEAEDVHDLYAKIAEIAPVPPAKEPTLARVVLKALEKDPADRYPDATALARDLEAWLHGGEVTVTGPSIARRVSRWTSARKPAIVGAGVALAVMIPLLVVVALRKPDQPVAVPSSTPTPTVAPTATATPAAPKDDPAARASRLLAEALQYRMDHPADAKGIEERFRSISERYPATDGGRVAAQTLREIQEEHSKLWQAGLDVVREEMKELALKGDYVGAVARVEMFRHRPGIDADTDADAAALETELVGKARKAIDESETSVRDRLSVPEQAERILEVLRGLKLAPDLAAVRDEKARALEAEVAKAKEKIAGDAASVDAKKRAADVVKLALATAAGGDVEGAVKTVATARADASLAPAKAELDALAARVDRLAAGEKAVVAALEAMPDGPIGVGLTGKVESVDARALELHVRLKSGKKNAPLARVPAERLLKALEPGARLGAGEWLLIRGAGTLALALLEQAGAEPELIARARELAAAEGGKEAEQALDRAIAEATKEGVAPEAALKTIKAAVDENRASPAYASRRDKLVAAALAARTAEIAREPAAIFHGKAKLDPKTSMVTLTYDWKSAEEAADWEAETRWPGAKLELKKGSASITGKVRLLARFAGPVHVKATVTPLDESAPNVNVILHDQGGWGGLLVGFGFKAATYESTKIAADAPERANWIVKLPGIVLFETFEPDGDKKKITDWKCYASGDWHPSMLPANHKARIEIQKEDRGIVAKLNGRPVLVASRAALYTGALGGVGFVPETSGLVVHDVEVRGKLDPPWLKERAAVVAKADAEALVPPPGK